MKIESVDFYYLSMPEVLEIGDGSQDVLLVRVRAGEWEGWGECEASPLTSIASLVAPMSHSACQPVSASVVGQTLNGIEDIARIGALVRENSYDLLQSSHTFSGIDIALWDLLGRKLEAPVYELLGYQRAFAKVPYASALFGTTLPDPVRHLELRDLFDTELDTLRRWAAERPSTPEDSTYVAIDAEFDAIFERTRSLLELYTQGILLDRDRQHTGLWVWVLQQALEARKMSIGVNYEPWWDNLTHYPALLLFRAGTMAALAANHEDVIVALATQPTWSTPLTQQGVELRAHHFLHTRSVLDNEIVQSLPRWGGTKYYYPASSLIRQQLEGIAGELSSNPKRLLDRMEYRMGLANHLFKEEGKYYYNPTGAQFLGSWPHRDDDALGRLPLTGDFLDAGDTSPWSHGRHGQQFAAQIMQLDEVYRHIRQ